ncbi:1-aminocyclopropane-1-carboxylate deaminase/D-cysteine desulfhydrase [Stackebrandtia nassauensis]|uniref:Putative D-cysteine desulfhydrase (DcyD) n=1 Tax=Stackebrandtia nassauensis (strain DSM 44728 / CIP 108903 / NRRL B-16338 / NBRC 102104 / LLR-40K-21) TaxID=446470 RepID=D3PZB7_STANL|nr:pyridoxal-phosphate dependent enzyme [Stackebrandtia nassauensis]ADD41591.1 putative D-cysteine desulfhydrase (DcyD) [Stackebrandtia nassauensis DSM 44728]
MNPDVTRGLEPVLPSPVVELRDERLERHGVRVLVKRDDLIHPDVPGNKWRKLKYNLEVARERGFATLLTFGGAYSNHVRAVAAAGRALGFATVGVIRGEERLPLNPSLEFAVRQGMRLTYMDRTTYRRKTDADVVAGLRERFGEFYLIPEGGSNALAVKGCAELPGEIDVDYDLVCCASGTGGTLAGIAAGLPDGKRALGFQVLKGGDFLSEEVRRLQREAYGNVGDNWSINADFHFGGYAKRTPELLAFIDDFRARHGIELDRIYTAKMMCGTFRLVETKQIPAGTTAIAIIAGLVPPRHPGAGVAVSR